MTSRADCGCVYDMGVRMVPCPTHISEHRGNICQTTCLDCATRQAEIERLTAKLVAAVATIEDYKSAGQTVRDDCAQEALAEAQVCGCGQRIAERIRTVKGKGFSVANACPRCRGWLPCGCGYYPAAPSLQDQPDAE